MPDVQQSDDLHTAMQPLDIICCRPPAHAAEQLMAMAMQAEQVSGAQAAADGA